jgi:thiopeptide-type bacteriocin biosynthesis protein
MDAATSGKLVVEIPDDPQKPDSNEDEMLKDGVTFQPSTTLLFRPLHLEGKESYFFEGVAGNCAIDIMGRFGHTDRNIAKSIKEIAEHERSVNPGFIFADILHLPEARTGNLILRPEIYDYQIPFIGKPTKSEDGVIGIDDIMVSVNHRGLVLLRSKRLNKYIIPRLSNSHNFYQNALPVYGFLCSVQNQATYQSIGFRWGQIGNYFKFHPRVVYRNCIVSLAKWKVTRAEIGDILKLFSNGDQSYTLKLNQWRADRKIPEKVLLTQSDNELFVDFENELSVATFLDEVKGKTQFDLKEFIYKNAGDSYPYVCQIAVPLLLNKVQTKGLLNNVLDNGNVNKVLLSGHEVVYFKVYGGEKIVEKLLNAEIVPLIDSLIADGMITTWFFIRYQDPEHHFRIRLFPSDNCDLNKVFQLFNEIFSKQIRLKMLADVKLDTYKRELRRYHGDLMDVSELLFFHDSKCIAKLLELIRQSADPEKYRWLIALINVDYLLNDFAFGVQDKHALLKHLRVAYFHEFNGNVQLNRMLSNKYRASKSDIERMLKTDEEKEQLLLEINAILGQRSASIREINAVIMQKEDMHSLSDLLSSYIHMSLNRIFLTSPRKHELVIYDYLERYYASTIKKSIYA